MGDVSKTLVGAIGTLSIGPWVAAGGAGTLVDMGFTVEGQDVTDQIEHFDLEIDQAQGIVRSIPIKKSVSLKVALAEADLAKLQTILGQPAGNMSGTAPAVSLEVGSEAERYFQVQFTSPGPPSAGGAKVTRTWTMWRCSLKRDAMPLKKNGITKVGVTITVLEDLSITGGNKGTFYKITEALAS